MGHPLAGDAKPEARMAKEIQKTRRLASVRLSDPSMKEAMRMIEGRQEAVRRAFGETLL